MQHAYAIDYDGTYTLNPRMWDEVLEHFRDRGIIVICTTSRSPTDGQAVAAALTGKVQKILYCGSHYKSAICRAAGYEIEVWIDNDPRTDRPPAPLWFCRLVGALAAARDALSSAFWPRKG